jgi:hypothetical protein
VKQNDNQKKGKTESMPVVQRHQKQIARLQVPCKRQEVERPPMCRLRQAIPADGTMTATHGEIHELISELRGQLDKVREKVAWLELKQSELRPGDQISYLGFLEAKQNLAVEQSLLSGHALMVQEDIQKWRITIDPQSARILKEIVRYSRSMYM